MGPPHVKRAPRVDPICIVILAREGSIARDREVGGAHVWGQVESDHLLQCEARVWGQVPHMHDRGDLTQSRDRSDFTQPRPRVAL